MADSVTAAGVSRLERVLILTACVMATSVFAAEDLESLDADFLAYLAELEGDEDDWTIVETPAKSEPSKKLEPSTSKSATKPPESKSDDTDGNER